MKEYDVIVVGSGAGSLIVEEALGHNFKTALVDKGPLGGTCLNVGCIPTKMLIASADRIVEIQNSHELGIRAEIREIDFRGIMDRMRSSVADSRNKIRRGIQAVPDLDYYEGPGRFVDDYTMEVAGQKFRGKKIFLASGARPGIPDIEGLSETGFLTNESVLDLTDRPESLLIVGGGYIAVEFGHFFAAMGTRVTLVQRGERLVKEEEPEIARILETELKKRMTVLTRMEVVEARISDKGIRVFTRDRETGARREDLAARVLVAAGRRSNADILEVSATGVKTDVRGYIQVSDTFETSKPGIWAFGDAIGKKMFRHSANHEAGLVWENAVHGRNLTLDYRKVPHAVFAWPPIASVGLTEKEAKKTGDVLVGTARYTDVAKGEAMRVQAGFAKAVLDKSDGKILGFHIIGPYAPILIQEVVNAMTVGETIYPIYAGMHIHPALAEVIPAVFSRIAPSE